MNHTVILPERKQHKQRFTNFPTILKFEDNNEAVGPASKWLFFAVLARNQHMIM